MKTQNPWGVTIAAIAGGASPDAVSLFTDKLNGVLEILVRAGQLGVAVMTILYIYRKWQAAAQRKKEDKQCDPRICSKP